MMHSYVIKKRQSSCKNLGKSIWIAVTSTVTGCTSLPKVEAVELVEAPAAVEMTSEQILTSFCDGEKPKRSVKQVMQFITPRVQGKTPLDKAQKLLKQANEAADRAAFSFFHYASISREYFQRRRQAEPRDHSNQVAGAPIWLFSGSEDRASVVTVIDPGWKNFRETNFELELLTQFPIPAENYASSVFVSSNLASKFWTYALVDKKQFQTEKVDSHEFLTQKTASKIRGGHQYGLASGSIKKEVEMAFPPKGYKEIVPLEMSALIQSFSLLPTFEALAEWEAELQKRIGRQGSALGAVRQELGKQISISSAVAKSDEIWKAYFIANTEVKKTSAKDKHTIYQIELKTDGLCKFATPTSDLMSK